MFAIRSLGRALFGDDTNKIEICTIPSGQLYLVRPSGVKGTSECIFKDAQATISRTNQIFCYQLIIERAYEEGEDELEDEALGPDSSGDVKDFLLDESIKFRTTEKDQCTIFQWRDFQGDSGDAYTFVCDPATKPAEAAAFELVALQCLYERKYQRSHQEATEEDLEDLKLMPSSPHSQSLPNTPDKTKKEFKSLAGSRRQPSGQESKPAKAKDQSKGKSPPIAHDAPAQSVEELVSVEAELHIFDASAGVFELQESNVIATVSEIGKWEYWLSIEDSNGKIWLGQPMEAEMNPVFNYEQKCFIWNYYDDDESAYSWLLKFVDVPITEKFQEGVMRALWERLNELKWQKQKDVDRDYLMSIQEDTPMEDVEEEAEDDRGMDAEPDDEDLPDAYLDAREEDVDEYEDADEVQRMDGEGENSQLAVGYKHDRSFVVRGDKIGVFRHTDDDRLEFATSINRIQKPKGAKFNPSKVMLHQEDTSMIMQDPNDQSHLYKMDLEYGKIVDEWKIHDDVPLTTFAAASKFAGMTGEQTLVGLSKNGLYRVDPRLSGTKLVDSEFKQYQTKNEFSAAATTEAGYIAVASSKGDIRLFDRLGINAKTALPPMSAPIIGIDVSADGKWVLATTKTYILLIDAMITEGKNAGSSGFTKSFAKDSKPRPRILQLNPEHVAMMEGKLSFTPAKFNAGADTPEKSIVTSTGPFVISWSLNQIVTKGKLDKYRIKKYQDEVKADSFKFGTDKNVIVALPHDVSMVDKQAFRKPTRASIATPTRRRLGRNDVVNSPF